MDVYEQPQSGKSYSIADTSHGKGMDYSSPSSVFDITQIPYRQVTKYRDNVISPMVYPNVIYQIGRRYNNHGL